MEDMKEASSRQRNHRATILLVVLLLTGAVVVIKRSEIRSWIKNTVPGARTAVGQKTVADQLGIYGPDARARWAPVFAAKKLSYRPKQIVFVPIKDSRKLEVYATNDQGNPVDLCSYPVLAASGILGPKLREGDRQVPEGIYKLTPEPNTPYHLALRLNYPNELDWAHAKEDGRANPGSDILIHGSNGSIGCLAMGDPASEDLFVLACDAQNQPLELIICPVDFRKSSEAPPVENAPAWLPQLYSDLAAALKKLPSPDNT